MLSERDRFEEESLMNGWMVGWMDGSVDCIMCCITILRLKTAAVLMIKQREEKRDSRKRGCVLPYGLDWTTSAGRPVTAVAGLKQSLRAYQ